MTPDAKFTADRKKVIVKLIIILLIAASAIVLWQLKSYQDQRKELVIEKKASQIDILEKNIEEVKITRTAKDTVAEENGKTVVLTGIRKSLPAVIDEMTTVSEANFIGNCLTFSVVIDGTKAETEKLTKLKDPDTINDMLQKNKPVACNIMMHLPEWEPNWTLAYEYSVSVSNEKLGRAEFNLGQCQGK